MNVSEALLTRRSSRRFTSRDIPRELASEILQIALRTPSGGNLQPWHVHVLDGEPLRDLVATISDSMSITPEGDEPEYLIYPPDLREPYRSRRFRNGEMLFACLGIQRDDKQGRRANFERNYRFFDAPMAFIFSIDRCMQQGQWTDLGMFIQSVMLLAHERGLGTCPMESVSVWHRHIRKTCAIPVEQIVFCGMAIGWAEPAAAVNTLVTERASLEEVVTFVNR